MGSSIALAMAQFIFGIEELEMISRERKLQRERLREGKARDKGT